MDETRAALLKKLQSIDETITISGGWWVGGYSATEATHEGVGSTYAATGHGPRGPVRVGRKDRRRWRDAKNKGREVDWDSVDSDSELDDAMYTVDELIDMGLKSGRDYYYMQLSDDEDVQFSTDEAGLQAEWDESLEHCFNLERRWEDMETKELQEFVDELLLD